MKKFFCMLLTAVMFVSFILNTSAAVRTEYYIEEGAFSLIIPDDYLVITDDIDENQPVFSGDIDKDWINAYMAAENIYIFAWNTLGIDQIFIVTIEENEEEDSRIHSESQLKEGIPYLEKGLGEADIKLEKCEVINTPQGLYYKEYVKATDDITGSAIAYTTVRNYKAITIAMANYDCAEYSDFDDETTAIFESIKFDDYSPFDDNLSEEERQKINDKSILSSFVSIFALMMGFFYFVFSFIDKIPARSGEAAKQQNTITQNANTPHMYVQPVNISEDKIYTNNAPVVRFCRKCGARLEAGSEFCVNCGTKIMR